MLRIFAPLFLLCVIVQTALAESSILMHCSFDDGDLSGFNCVPTGKLAPRKGKGAPDTSKIAVVEGVHGKALELKEGNKVKYVFSDVSSLQELKPPFTIALWMKKYRELPKRGIWLATSSDQPKPGGFEFFWNWRRVTFRWAKKLEVASPTSILHFNKWHHVAVTHDTRNITLYIDAIPVAQKQDDGTFAPLPQEMRKKYLPTVGQYPTPFSAYPHVGLIDEIYVLTKALDANELASLAMGTYKE